MMMDLDTIKKANRDPVKFARSRLSDGERELDPLPKKSDKKTHDVH